LFIVLTNINLEVILVKKYFMPQIDRLRAGHLNGRRKQLFIDTSNLYTLYSEQEKRNAAYNKIVHRRLRLCKRFQSLPDFGMRIRKEN
jgi:hypothetical protein